jgi:hypothetical protein
MSYAVAGTKGKEGNEGVREMGSESERLNLCYLCGLL